MADDPVDDLLQRYSRPADAIVSGTPFGQSGELRAYHEPWYRALPNAAAEAYASARQYLAGGKEGPTPREADAFRTGLGVDNPFNIPGQVHHGFDEARGGVGSGDWRRAGLGALEMAMAIAPMPKGTPKPKIDPLIAVHNAHPTALNTWDRIGGIPSPSIAVTKADRGFDNFGSVSLLYGPDTVKPKASNPVYPSDGWTARHPEVRNTFTREQEDRLKSAIASPFAEKMDTSGVLDAMERSRWSDAAREKSIMLSYAREAGIPVPSEVAAGDRWSVQNWLKERLGRDPSDDLELHAQSLVNDLAPTRKERLWLGYDDNGFNRYKPYTAQNAVNAMKREGGAGAEGGMLTMGNIRAQLSHPFRNMTEMKDARGAIVPKEVWEKQSDVASDALFKLQEAADPYWKWGKSHNPFMHGDAVREELIPVMRSPDHYWSPYRKDPAFDQFPPDLIQQAKDTRDLIKAIGTDYFEAKPRRVVPIGEARGAIVTPETPEATVDLLRRNGVDNIVKRPGKDISDHAAALQAFKDLMFSGVAPAIGIGALAPFASGHQDQQFADGGRVAGKIRRQRKPRSVDEALGQYD